MPSLAVLVPAGGIGSRLGRRTPKQFLHLGGGTILARTLAHFLRHPDVRSIVIAAPAEYLVRTRRLVVRPGRRGVEIVAGGENRQTSIQ